MASVIHCRSCLCVFIIICTASLATCDAAIAGSQRTNQFRTAAWNSIRVFWFLSIASFVIFLLCGRHIRWCKSQVEHQFGSINSDFNQLMNPTALILRICGSCTICATSMMLEASVALKKIDFFFPFRSIVHQSGPFKIENSSTLRETDANESLPMWLRPFEWRLEKVSWNCAWHFGCNLCARERAHTHSFLVDGDRAHISKSFDSLANSNLQFYLTSGECSGCGVAAPWLLPD